MINEIDIRELMKIKIGQIKKLEQSQGIVQGVIDQQRESIKFTIKQEKIYEDWADKFMEDIDDN